MVQLPSTSLTSSTCYNGPASLISLVLQHSKYSPAFAPWNLLFPWLRKAFPQDMFMIWSLTLFKSVFKYHSLRNAFILLHQRLTQLPMPTQSIILYPLICPLFPHNTNHHLILNYTLVDSLLGFPHQNVSSMKTNHCLLLYPQHWNNAWCPISVQ